MISKGTVVPLFCIASHHSSSYTYKWDNLNGEVGMHSPILYANKPGVYRCTVDDDLGHICYSKSISVTEGALLLYI